ncbi:MAG: translation initiation factor [Muribaculaceae bacterium]|nr:translation initiation factor [Muribaculaceae bacterium]
MEDWRDKLGAAFGMEVPATTTAQQENNEPDKGDAIAQQGHQVVHIVLEKKGRNGKQATIITDFLCDDDALKKLARQLKQLCGVGGSARGGEILLQGDQRETVKQHLLSLGFKVK